MSRDGSGNFNLPAGNPAVDGTEIDLAVHNTTLSQIATALTESIAKDGQTVPTGDLPMGTRKHTNVGDASARNHYAAAKQVQDGAFQVVGSVSGSNVIVGSLSPAITAYSYGMHVVFTPAITNTGATTLALNGLTALDVYKRAVVPLAAGDLVAGVPAFLVMDSGANDWVLINPQNQAASLPSNVALEDAANIFTTQQTIAMGSPMLRFDETDATAENGHWAIVTGGEAFYVRAYDDTWATVDNLFKAERTGVSIDYVDITAADIRFNGGDLPVSMGGTGSGTAADARTALGVMPLDASTLTGMLGSAMGATDQFLVMDGTSPKTVEYSDAGLRVATVTGTSDTLATGDMNTFIEYTNASPVTVTLNNSVGVVGNIVVIKQTGAGQVTIAGTATKEAAIGLKTRDTHSVICLVCIAANTWSVFGDCAA